MHLTICEPLSKTCLPVVWRQLTVSSTKPLTCVCRPDEHTGLAVAGIRNRSAQLPSAYPLQTDFVCNNGAKRKVNRIWETSTGASLPHWHVSTWSAGWEVIWTWPSLLKINLSRTKFKPPIVFLAKSNFQEEVGCLEPFSAGLAVGGGMVLSALWSGREVSWIFVSMFFSWKFCLCVSFLASLILCPSLVPRISNQCYCLLIKSTGCSLSI